MGFILFFCILFLVFVTGCVGQTNEQTQPPLDEVVGNDYDSVEELSTSHYSDITNRHFEEISSGYHAAFSTKDEIVSERIASWFDSRLPGDGFYKFISSDPESWNMFIYYSPKDGLFGHYSFQFSIVDSTVNIYVVTDDASPIFLPNYMLILVQAPPRGVRPSIAVLYIDGIEIKMYEAMFN